MRLPLFAYPYKVRSEVSGWRGWRLASWSLYVCHPCPCPGVEHYFECECDGRGPHRHTHFGWLDRPLGLP